MLDIVIDTSDFDAYRRSFSARHERAWRTAFRVEGFRLRRVTQEHLRQGVGPPRHPLTKKLAKSRGPRALRALAPMIAYEVRNVGPAEFEALIGLTAQGRRRRRPIPEEWAELATVGGWIKVTRERQNFIAFRRRRRLGEPVNIRGRRARRPARYAWDPLTKPAFPKVGHTAYLPERDWVTEIVRAEFRRATANIARNYRAKLRGERI